MPELCHSSWLWHLCDSCCFVRILRYAIRIDDMTKEGNAPLLEFTLALVRCDSSILDLLQSSLQRDVMFLGGVLKNKNFISVTQNTFLAFEERNCSDLHFYCCHTSASGNALGHY